MAVINTNVKALFSQMALKGSGIEQARAMQQLSTGKRINSARDDAAGMAIATRMTHQIRSLNQAVRNAGDAINLIQTAEGATNEITDMMQRMRELAVQAVNDTNDNAQRSYLDLEFQQLKQQIVQIADNTEWNGFPVLNGSAGERVGEMPVYKATSVSISKTGDIFIAEPENPSVSGQNAGQQQIMTFGGDGTTQPEAGTYEISLVDKDSNTHTASVSISVAEASGGWSTVVGKIKTVLDTEFKTLTSSVKVGEVPQVDKVTFSPPLEEGDVVVIDGTSVTLAAADSPAEFAQQIKDAMEQDTFDAASGRSIIVDPDTGAMTFTYATDEGAVTPIVATVGGTPVTTQTTQLYGFQVALNVLPDQGDLADLTIAAAAGTTPVLADAQTADAPISSMAAIDVAAATATWDPQGGQFIQSGALSMNVKADGQVEAEFITSRNEHIMMIGVLHPTDGRITFDKNVARNAEVISANLTYAVKDAAGDPMSAWMGRAVSLNVAVEGKLPAMQDGDLYINGVNIGASYASDDTLSPADNASGSAIAKAAAINRMAVASGVTVGEEQTLTLTGTPNPNEVLTIGGVDIQLSGVAMTAPQAAAEIFAKLKASTKFAEVTGRSLSYQPGSSVISIKYAKEEGDVADIEFNAKASGLRGIVDTTVEHFTAIPGTGVFAKVNENVMTGSAMTGTSVVRGAVFINGYASANIATVLNNTRATRTEVVRAINMITDKTGVKAIDTGSDAKGVTLVAADGRNIEIRFETSDNVDDFAARTGLRQGLQAGTYSLESKIPAPVVISSTGDITRTGLIEGNFTKNQSVVNTSSRPTVDAPVSQVDRILVGGDPTSDAATDTYSVTVNGVQFSVTNTAGSSKSEIRDALVVEINKKKSIIGVTASAGDSLEELKLTANTAGIPFTTSAEASDNAVGSLGYSNLVPNSPAQFKPLGANDLMINGVPIRESTPQDDLLSNTVSSSSSSSASAIAIANAINSQSSTTGVRAQANAVVSETTVTDRYLPATPARYSLYVNGTEVSVFMDPTDTEQVRRTNVMKAINERTGQHGVTAKDNGTGGLTLTTDGRNLSVWFDSSIKDLSAASFGLGKAGAVKQVSTLTFDTSAQTTVGKSATVVINDQSITVKSENAGDDFAELLKTKIEANPYLQNISVEVNSGVMTFTSKVAGSGFAISGVSTDSDVTTAMDVATVTANSTGKNDVTAIYRATETSATAKTMYGTVRMISDPALLPRGMPAPDGAPPSDKQDLLKATGRPFTVSVGDDGFGANSNFSSLGFEEGTFGGQSSAAMDPPRVGRLAFQVGSSTRQVITIDLADFGKNGPITSEITGDVDLNVEDRTTRINTREGASAVLDKLDVVMDKINATRATMGAVMNRLDHVINNLTNVSMNLSASRSAIEDADYASASTELAKTQIMQQAATAVLAQANTSQQTVMKLLGG